MNGKVILEVELSPEIQGLGPRRGIRFEMSGPLRGVASSPRQTPSLAGQQIKSPTTFSGTPVVVIDANAATSRHWGWLEADENLDEMIFSYVTSTVDQSGRGTVDTAEQTSDALIGHPILWNWSGVRTLYVSSARFSEDHPYALWWAGDDATAVSVTVMEFESDMYTVEESQI